MLAVFCWSNDLRILVQNHHTDLDAFSRWYEGFGVAGELLAIGHLLTLSYLRLVLLLVLWWGWVLCLLVLGREGLNLLGWWYKLVRRMLVVLRGPLKLLVKLLEWTFRLLRRSLLHRVTLICKQSVKFIWLIWRLRRILLRSCLLLIGILSHILINWFK